MTQSPPRSDDFHSLDLFLVLARPRFSSPLHRPPSSPFQNPPPNSTKLYVKKEKRGENEEGLWCICEGCECWRRFKVVGLGVNVVVIIAGVFVFEKRLSFVFFWVRREIDL